jgi:hypothetical protein
MKYIIPYTDLNKSQVQNIKCLNALISQEAEGIEVLKNAPKTPTGRWTKATQKDIDCRQAVVNNLREQREVFLKALKEDIYNWFEATMVKRTDELLSEDSHHFSRVLSKALKSNMPEPVMNSETIGWHLQVSSADNGYISISLNTSSQRMSWGDFSIKRSTRERGENKYNVKDWIEKFEFEFTSAGLEFDAYTIDSSYSLYTTQVDNLKSGDVNALITLLGELKRVQDYLNTNSDLATLDLLANTYLWVEKVFDLEIK